jgi:hypothetical protein
MSILAEQLIDQIAKQESYSHYDFVYISTLHATYRNNHTYKSAYATKIKNLFFKIMKEYDGTNAELNDFMKKNIELYMYDNISYKFYFFDYKKHKFLLDDLQGRIELSNGILDTIQNHEDALEFIEKYLFKINFNVYIERFSENKFLMKILEKCIPSEHSEIIKFAEKIFTLFRKSYIIVSSDFYKNLDDKNEFNVIIKLLIYSSSFLDKNFNLDSDYKRIFYAFETMRDKKLPINDGDDIQYCLTVHNLELAFKYCNANVAKFLINNKIKTNKQCLINIFTSEKSDDEMKEMLEIFTNTQQITQEYFMIILENSIPNTFPDNIVINDKIVELYVSKNFELLYDKINNKDLTKKIITAKINDGNFTVNEIKRMQDYIILNNLKFNKGELSNDNLEKIANKNVKKNIMKRIDNGV